MINSTARQLAAVGVALLALTAGRPTSEAYAQEQPANEAASPVQPAANGQQIEELVNRLNKVERDLERLRAKNSVIPAEKKDQQLLTLLETPYLGSTYYRAPQGVRFFAARVIFINLTPEPVTIKREQIELVVDDTAMPLVDLPAQIQYQSFQVGNQTMQLRNLKMPNELTVASGQTGGTWIAFSGLPPGNHIPKLALKINRGESKTELDVNEFAAGLLGMKVERIGPRGSLGLLTISGSFNTINIGTLVEALDQLSAQKVARAVIRWTESAAPLDSTLSSWLQQASLQAGRGEVMNNQLPAIPASIRELHLAEVPNQNAGTRYAASPSSPPRIHKTADEAVTAALSSAYEVLPRDELLKEIEQGHPLTRAAALAGGGGRLSADRLPVVLKYADDNDPRMQRAALVALQHFGEKEALDKLASFGRKNAEPLSTAALESLAASRYAAAHETLLDILKNEPPDSKKNIVAVLAKHPRPIWSEPLYQFAKDPNSEVVAEALKALVRVGHPQVEEVLEQSLKQEGNAALRNEAFNLLVSRTDPKSEELAMDFTLKHLETQLPTPPMNVLMARTKDRRAVELLLKHFDRSAANRASVIGTLAGIGDQSVAELFVKHYPTLNDNEKRTVLSALQQMRSPEFRRLAGEALMTSDSSLISVASQGLQADGSDEAVSMLANALEKSNHTTTWSYVANALAAVGTPEAQAALSKARDSNNTNKSNYANNALRNLRQRSPGYQYIYQAQQFVAQEKWKEAIDQYRIALELDPQLPEAYAGRAQVLLKQDKPQEAHKDFIKALELDPYNSQAVTGLGIVMVLEGKYEAAITFVEDARKKFANDVYFAYNTACVYGRAVEYLQKNKDAKIEDREKKLQDYQQKSLAELKRSVTLGFRDFNWMQKDPDLKSLAEVPEFKQIHTPNAKTDPAQEDAQPARVRPRL